MARAFHWLNDNHMYQEHVIHFIIRLPVEGLRVEELVIGHLII